MTIALTGCNDTIVGDHALTKADIPKDLPSDLRELIADTFSDSAVERGRAAQALGEMRDRAGPAVPFLIRLLADGSEWRVSRRRLQTVPWSVRMEASLALAKLGKAAVPHCIDALKRKKGTPEGLELIEILGASRDSRAIEPLVELLSDPDSQIRDAVIHAFLFLNDPRVVPPLISALRDGDSTVRRSAVWVLGSIQDSRAVEPLLNLLSGKDLDVRTSAAEALGKQGDPRAVPALLKILRDASEHSYVRMASGRALGRIGEANSLGALVDVVNDRSVPWNVRAATARGLAISKDSRFAKPLTIVLTDRTENADFRGCIVDDLADLEGTRMVPLLTQIAIAANEDDHVRCCAAVQVARLTSGAIDQVEVVNALDGRYFESDEPDKGQQPEWRSRREALKAIAEHGKTEAVRDAAKTRLGKR